MAYDDIGDPTTSIESKYDEAIAVGWATAADKADALQQLDFILANAADLESQHPGKWIAVAAEEVFEGNGPVEAENAAKAAHLDRQYICLPIPPARARMVI